MKIKINLRYGDVFPKGKISKLAQENARYFVTVFMPTQMIYTTSFRQINYIASWLSSYVDNANMNNDFERKLAISMQEFLIELERLNILEPGLMANEKSRNISLFGNRLEDKKEFFDYQYQTVYTGSFAQVAQAQRHRTLNYQIQMLDDKKYFIPPIIEDDPVLVSEWLNDMESVKNVMPQGEKVLICESGTYDNFILKCKERLCSGAQLEIMLQTKDTLEKMATSFYENGHTLASDIEKYRRGARCTFSDFKCTSDCKFKEGKVLTRKI